MFKDWIVDTPEDDRRVMDHDMKIWKIPRMLRKENLIKSVEKIMLDNAELLKTTFIVAASRGG